MVVNQKESFVRTQKTEFLPFPFQQGLLFVMSENKALSNDSFDFVAQNIECIGTNETSNALSPRQQLCLD